jgi:hypothetical protein
MERIVRRTWFSRMGSSKEAIISAWHGAASTFVFKEKQKYTQVPGSARPALFPFYGPQT